MIWTVTTKEFAITGCVYVSLDGKNKQIVQVHNCEKAYQTFNTVTNLYHFHLFFAPEFFCLDDSHCNEKGSCNNVLGNCACEEGMSGFLDCTFCKFRINIPFQKMFFSFPILSIFGTDICKNITNYFCTNFKQEHFKFYALPTITFVDVAIEATFNYTEFVRLFGRKILFRTVVNHNLMIKKIN